MRTLRRTCETVPQPSELRFRVVLAVGRGTAVLDGGQRSPTGRGHLGGFVLHFHNGKCHRIADGEMFPIRMRKLDKYFRSPNVSLESSIHGLFADVFGFSIDVGVYGKLSKQKL